MGRQLFLHHYLPAHLASALVTGALLEFIFNLDPIALEENAVATNNANLNSLSSSNASASKSGKKAANGASHGKTVIPRKERMAGSSLLALWGAVGVVMTLVIGGWWYFLPLTYGKPGLSAEQVVARKWLGYDLHFAK